MPGGLTRDFLNYETIFIITKIVLITRPHGYFNLKTHNYTKHLSFPRVQVNYKDCIYLEYASRYINI